METTNRLVVSANRLLHRLLARPPPLRVLLRVLAVSLFVSAFVVLASWHGNWKEGARIIKQITGYNYPSLADPQTSRRHHYQACNSSIEQALQHLFQPSIIPPTTPQVQAHDGSVHDLPQTGALPFPDSLGKKLCLVDMDGRSFDGDNEVFSDKPMDMNNQPGTSFSSGVINHFMYANIHGYTYKYIRTSAPPPDRAGVWMEVKANLEMLEKTGCEVVVNADSDAIFAHLELPLEWLFNRWNFSTQYHVAMSLDPNQDMPPNGGSSDNSAYFRDDYGATWANPGFIVLRNTQLMRDMLQAWWDCPSNETQYPGCHRWIKNWPAEMGAFGNHIRYDPRFKDASLELPCNEANGHPDYDAQRIPCHGLWVRHYAGHNDHLYGGFVESMMWAMSNVMHFDMAARKDELVQHQGMINITVGAGATNTSAEDYSNSSRV